MERTCRICFKLKSLTACGSFSNNVLSRESRAFQNYFNLRNSHQLLMKHAPNYTFSEGAWDSWSFLVLYLFRALIELIIGTKVPDRPAPHSSLPNSTDAMVWFWNCIGLGS